MIENRILASWQKMTLKKSAGSENESSRLFKQIKMK